MKNKILQKNKILHIIILLLLLQFILPSASSLAIDAAPPISDREIIEKLVRLESGQDALNHRITDLRSEMKAGQDALRSEMKAGQEALRSEMKAGQEALNHRITDFRSEMKAGQEALSKRLDDSNSTMLAFFGAIITLIVALFAYIAWDRRTMIKPVINKLDQLERNVVNDLDLHHSEGSLVRRQLKVLREYARHNPEVAEIMRELSLLRNEPV